MANPDWLKPALIAGGAVAGILVGWKLGQAQTRALRNTSDGEDKDKDALKGVNVKELHTALCGINSRLEVLEAKLPAPTSCSKEEPSDQGQSGPEPAAIQTELIDGKAVAAEVRGEVKAYAVQLEKEHGVIPGLAVILVGSRKDSQSYVRNKKKAAAEVCFYTVDVDLPETVSQEDLLSEVEKLNNDPKVHAILVQLPLPKHIDEPTVLKAIRVDKDADGFSAMNIGNLCLKGGDPPMAVPCTPAGCIELLQRSNVQVAGKNAVVIGRSNIVGMPVSQLLQSMDATVTVCHSRTKDMISYIRNADIVVAAIGKADFVRGDWLKPGCVVIDVGINPVDDPTKKLGYRLTGDVNFKEAQGIASKITPVPGGVGPMTIAMLLKNTLNLARLSLNLTRVPLRRVTTCMPEDLPAQQAAKPAAALAAAGADGVAEISPGEEVVIELSPPKGVDIWQAAVDANRLREIIREVANRTVPPSVIINANSVDKPPVAVVTIGTEAAPRRTLCEAETVDDAILVFKKK